MISMSLKQKANEVLVPFMVELQTNHVLKVSFSVAVGILVFALMIASGMLFNSEFVLHFAPIMGAASFSSTITGVYKVKYGMLVSMALTCFLVVLGYAIF